MDFFDMNFSTLFLEKHGKLVFKDIEKHIIQESSICYNHEYIEVIFKIATERNEIHMYPSPLNIKNKHSDTY